MPIVKMTVYSLNLYNRYYFERCPSELTELFSFTYSCGLLHENEKGLSPFYHKKLFLAENECKTRYGCLIHFLSKICFMIK